VHSKRRKTLSKRHRTLLESSATKIKHMVPGPTVSLPQHYIEVRGQFSDLHLSTSVSVEQEAK
jgi:hypothetical protein